MVMGEGWFINIYTGESVGVGEHMQAVKDNPGKYGLSPEDITDRENTLLRVLRNGWVRVRRHKAEAVFEFDSSDPEKAMRTIQEFMLEKGIIKYAYVRINAIRQHKSTSGRAKDIISDIDIDPMKPLGVADIYRRRIMFGEVSLYKGRPDEVDYLMENAFRNYIKGLKKGTWYIIVPVESGVVERLSSYCIEHNAVVIKNMFQDDSGCPQRALFIPRGDFEHAKLAVSSVENMKFIVGEVDKPWRLYSSESDEPLYEGVGFAYVEVVYSENVTDAVLEALMP